MADPVNQNDQQQVVIEPSLIQTITHLILANTSSKIKTTIKLDGELASLNSFILDSLKLFKIIHNINGANLFLRLTNEEFESNKSEKKYKDSYIWCSETQQLYYNEQLVPINNNELFAKLLPTQEEAVPRYVTDEEINEYITSKENHSRIKEHDEIPQDIVDSALLLIEKAILKHAPKELDEIKETVLMALITTGIINYDGYDLRDWFVFSEEKHKSLKTQLNNLLISSELDNQQEFFDLLEELGEINEDVRTELQKKPENTIQEKLGISKTELNGLIEYLKLDREIKYRTSLRINRSLIAKDLTNELKDFLQAPRLIKLQREFLNATVITSRTNKSETNLNIQKNDTNIKTLPSLAKANSEDNLQNKLSPSTPNYARKDRFFRTSSVQHLNKIEPVAQLKPKNENSDLVSVLTLAP